MAIVTIIKNTIITYIGLKITFLLVGSIYPNILYTINKMKLDLNQNLENTSKFGRKNLTASLAKLFDKTNA
jgi:hypothetical protein